MKAQYTPATNINPNVSLGKDSGFSIFRLTQPPDGQSDTSWLCANSISGTLNAAE